MHPQATYFSAGCEFNKSVVFLLKKDIIQSDVKRYPKYTNAGFRVQSSKHQLENDNKLIKITPVGIRA